MFQFDGMSKDETIDPRAKLLGRGAQSNAVGRFETLKQCYVDDGWPRDDRDTVVRTWVAEERPRQAITYNASPDLSFDRSINPYRGCEHGCIYCFARPTHAFLGMSPGLDFETRLIARPGMPEVLERELRKSGYVVKPIAIGTNTDPYQPVEQKYEIMRACLKVLSACKHPVAIVTKGSLIERDLDILGPMARQGLVRVGVSVTTLDRSLSRRLEPRTPTPERRLRMIEALKAADVPVRAMVSPIIPGLTDSQLEKILECCAQAGADAATWSMLRLPLEVSPLFQKWLLQHAPNRAKKVMHLLRDMHGGKDYDAQWFRRMRGQGPYADIIAKRFSNAARRLSLDRTTAPLRCDLFQPPIQAGDQLSLF